MATYTIVESDKDQLGPNEINAGDTIDVENGDIFIISEDADDNIKFESASGEPSNFEIRFEDSNDNDFNVEIGDDLDVGIVISSDVEMPDVDIDAKDSLSVIMTAGDDVSIGKYEGSEDGVDVVTIGHDFTTDHDIKLGGGDNFLSIGDNANIQDIESKDGDDTITIGDGLVAKDIKTGDGDDVITIGDNATLDDIETKDGDDTITVGDGLTADDIKTGDGDDAITLGDDATLDDIDTKDGDDSITIGDNLDADDIKTGNGDDALSIGDDGVVDDINTGNGDDSVLVGDDFTADKLETKSGDDAVTLGSGGSINDLDGGNGDDTLWGGTGYPDATNFETICFVRGTMIETEAGEGPIEALRVGDRIRTLDRGLQRIRWIGSTDVPGLGKHAPVRIAAGALGNARTLWVSQQHRMLLSGWKVELNFGEPQVLVAAKHLVGLSGVQIVERPTVQYFHMLFDRHEIVFAEGAASESFHPGAVGIGTLGEDQRDEIFSLFPDLKSAPNSFGAAARLSLRSFEARLLAA